MKYVVFCIWLLTVTLFLIILEHVSVFFFFFLVLMTQITHTDTHISLIHSSIVGSLGRIHFLSIMNNVSMNIHVQVFWRTYVSISSRTQEIPRSEIAGHVVNFYLTF